eukprot:XP_001692658.1 predicted protein [Chlamydomonas reinhardtii]
MATRARGAKCVRSDDGYGGNGFACVLPDRPEEYEATWGVGLCGWTSGGTYVSSVWAQMPNGTQFDGTHDWAELSPVLRYNLSSTPQYTADAQYVTCASWRTAVATPSTACGWPFRRLVGLNATVLTTNALTLDVCSVLDPATQNSTISTTVLFGQLLLPAYVAEVSELQPAMKLLGSSWVATVKTYNVMLQLRVPSSRSAIRASPSQPAACDVSDVASLQSAIARDMPYNASLLRVACSITLPADPATAAGGSSSSGRRQLLLGAGAGGRAESHASWLMNSRLLLPPMKYALLSDGDGSSSGSTPPPASCLPTWWASRNDFAPQLPTAVASSIQAALGLLASTSVSETWGSGGGGACLIEAATPTRIMELFMAAPVGAPGSSGGGGGDDGSSGVPLPPPPASTQFRRETPAAPGSGSGRGTDLASLAVPPSPPASGAQPKLVMPDSETHSNPT